MLVVNEEDMVGDPITIMISQLLQRLTLLVLRLDASKQIFNRLRLLFVSLTSKRGLKTIFYTPVIKVKMMIRLTVGLWAP